MATKGDKMAAETFGDVQVKESKIGQFQDGLGAFANRDFEKGEVVIKWKLRELTTKEYAALPEGERRQFTHKQNGRMLLFSEPERHVNRSENPNVRSDPDRGADVAIRDIKRGEELSIATDTSEDF